MINKIFEQLNILVHFLYYISPPYRQLIPLEIQMYPSYHYFDSPRVPPVPRLGIPVSMCLRLEELCLPVLIQHSSRKVHLEKDSKCSKLRTSRGLKWLFSNKN